MNGFTKKLLLSALTLIPTSVLAGNPGVGTHVNTSFTAVQGSQVNIVVDQSMVGKFWSGQDGRIYKAYGENGGVVVREILIDVVNQANPNAATPAQVWCENGQLLVQHGRLTLRHNPRWQNLVRRDLVGTGRTVMAPNAILPGFLPPVAVPEAVPVDTVTGRVLISEWTVVAVAAPVWLRGTIEPYEESVPTELPRARINGITPIPDPNFQQQQTVEDVPQPTLPLLVPPQN